ncbi:TPA: hypothetical protein ACKOR7_004091 [Clostridioides difficile]
MFNKNEILKKLIEEYDVKTTTDIQDMLKNLFTNTIHQIFTFADSLLASGSNNRSNFSINLFSS